MIYDDILISMCRKTIPKLLAFDIAGVQPMPKNLFSDLYLSVINYERKPKHKDIKHSFIEGWLTYDKKIGDWRPSTHKEWQKRFNNKKLRKSAKKLKVKLI